jgi:hypothetical protein
MEIEHRELVRKSRNLKFAGFDIIKTFEGYEFGDIQIPKSISRPGPLLIILKTLSFTSQ